MSFWTEHDPKYIRLSLPKHHTFAQKMNFESEPCKEKSAKNQHLVDVGILQNSTQMSESNFVPCCLVEVGENVLITATDSANGEPLNFGGLHI